jgi:hypothetical protein
MIQSRTYAAVFTGFEAACTVYYAMNGQSGWSIFHGVAFVFWVASALVKDLAP